MSALSAYILFCQKRASNPSEMVAGNQTLERQSVLVTAEPSLQPFLYSLRIRCSLQIHRTEGVGVRHTQECVCWVALFEQWCRIYQDAVEHWKTGSTYCEDLFKNSKLCARSRSKASDTRTLLIREIFTAKTRNQKNNLKCK